MNRREREEKREGKESERRVWRLLLTVNWNTQRKFWGIFSM